jgi:hypothetical protein
MHRSLVKTATYNVSFHILLTYVHVFVDLNMLHIPPCISTNVYIHTFTHIHILCIEIVYNTESV